MMGVAVGRRLRGDDLERLRAGLLLGGRELLFAHEGLRRGLGVNTRAHATEGRKGTKRILKNDTLIIPFTLSLGLYTVTAYGPPSKSPALMVERENGENVWWC